MVRFYNKHLEARTRPSVHIVLKSAHVSTVASNGTHEVQRSHPFHGVGLLVARATRPLAVNEDGFFVSKNRCKCRSATSHT